MDRRASTRAEPLRSRGPARRACASALQRSRASPSPGSGTRWTAGSADASCSAGGPPSAWTARGACWGPGGGGRAWWTPPAAEGGCWSAWPRVLPLRISRAPHAWADPSSTTTSCPPWGEDSTTRDACPELACDGARVHAAAVLQITKALSRFAVAGEHLAVDVAAPLRPQMLRAITNSERDRVVEADELPLLLSGLHQLGDPTRTLLRLLLATGVRTGELLGASRSEFDLEAAVWTIPPERQKLTRDKIEKAKPWRVPLAPSVVALLKSLKKPAPKSKWVLPRRLQGASRRCSPPCAGSGSRHATRARRRGQEGGRPGRPGTGAEDGAPVGR
ncbi:MAG: tyrosine-type recombinase/integrase [Anaeromyxobacter sp.]|nr:tyrosine-type recombinase/integrase [Anaeromyxobacter sp.]